MEQILPNWVLVEVDDSNKYLKLGDNKILIDTTFEPERRAQIEGTVIDFGSLFFKQDDPNSTDFDVPMELQKGDKVLFHFLAVNDAIAKGRWDIVDGKKLLFIPYDRIFVAIREKKLVPLNGWLFIKPKVEETTSSSIIIPDMARTSVSKTRGTVEYIGCTVNAYRNYPEQSDYGCDVNIGDEVLFNDADAVPLHDSLQQLLIGYYRIHRIDILSVVENAA